MLLIVDGRVSVSLRLPGDRARRGRRASGRGEVLGEIPLLDGGPPLGDGARDRAGDACSRSAARTSPRSSRGAIRRRSRSSGASPASRCARLRQQLAALAASLGGGDAAASRAADARRRARVLRAAGQRVRAAARDLPRLRLARALGLPDRRPLRALPGRAARWSPRGRASTACYVTINGAVEKVIVRGGRRIRVGLAGPGQAFGYESLIDGGPSPVTADHARADAAARAAAGGVRAALQRRDGRLARVPRRDPPRPDGGAAAGAAPARPAGGRASSRRAAAAGPPGTSVTSRNSVAKRMKR